jgi:hypothetical protein
MYKSIELKSLPNALEVYPRIATTLLKQPKSFLPSIEIKVPNVSITEADTKKYLEVCGFSPSKFIPSTYLFVHTFSLKTYLLSSLEIPFPVLGMVHFANRIKQIEPIQYNQPFDITCKTGNLIAHQKGQAFEVEVYIDIAGKRVYEETMVNLCKSKNEGIGQVFDWEIDNITDNFVGQTWDLKENLGIQYAQASGDFNPIHLHPLSAKLFGFKRHIIHGMYSASRILAQFPKKIEEAHQFDVAFKTPIFLPSQVIFRHQQENNKIVLDVVDKTQTQPHLKGILI